MDSVLVLAAIFSSSVISGMLGIGVAFAAIPVLSLGKLDLVHQVQPIALFLNGTTALFSAIAFSRAGYVEWRSAARLALVASVFSPLGAAAAAAATSESALWIVYFAAVGAVVYLLCVERPPARAPLQFSLVLWMSAPIAALSGLLGVGPGFLIVPLMVYGGYGPRRAAAINAVAVVPASFISLLPHLGQAAVRPAAAVPIVLSAAFGALIGGVLSSTRVPEKALRQLFVVVIVGLSIYKGIVLLADLQR